MARFTRGRPQLTYYQGDGDIRLSWWMGTFATPADFLASGQEIPVTFGGSGIVFWPDFTLPAATVAGSLRALQPNQSAPLLPDEDAAVRVAVAAHQAAVRAGEAAAAEAARRKAPGAPGEGINLYGGLNEGVDEDWY